MADHRITVKEIQALMPVEHLSPSSVADFLEDRRRFRKKWIDMDFGANMPQAMAEGTVYHAGMETYWLVQMGRREVDDLSEEMMRYAYEAIKKDEEYIDFKFKRIAAKAVAECSDAGMKVEKRQTKAGKDVWYAQDNTETMISRIGLLFDSYIAEAPKAYGKCVAVEQRIKAQTLDLDSKLPHLCPLKGRIDRADFDEETGTLTIVDYKLSSRDLELDEDERPLPQPRWVMAAAAYESLAPELAKILGLEGKVKSVRVIFEHVAKASGTRTAVQMGIGEKERLAWSRIMRGVIYSLALAAFLPQGTDPYLPSPAATMSGETEGWDAFIEDIAVELGEAEPRTRSTIADAEALEI